MFSVTQSVENTSGAEVRLAPYGIVARHGLPDDLQNFFILHEGVVRKVDGQLDEISYDNVTELDFVERERAQAEVVQVEENGWIGFTDKYWMTTLIPGDGQPFTSVTRYVASRDIYQTEARLPVVSVGPAAPARSRRSSSPAPRNGKRSATTRTRAASTGSSTRSTGAGSTS
jgi:YidC/Oxa1 family membrane protein insertase